MRFPVLFLALAGRRPRGAGRRRAPKTLRLEYIHSGTAEQERFALHAIAREGDWPGPMGVEDIALGKYRVEVKDAKTGATLFARGFASIYGEWETTGEAKELARAFQESVRFPEPVSPVRVSILKRNAKGEFAESWSRRSWTRRTRPSTAPRRRRA